MVLFFLAPLVRLGHTVVLDWTLRRSINSLRSSGRNMSLLPTFTYGIKREQTQPYSVWTDIPPRNSAASLIDKSLLGAMTHRLLKLDPACLLEPSSILELGALVLPCKEIPIPAHVPLENPLASLWALSPFHERF